MDMEQEKKDLTRERYDLVLSSVNHARVCIKDHRGDLALKALDIVELQITKLKPE